MKKLLLLILLLINIPSYAQLNKEFPRDIENHHKNDDFSIENKKTQLQLVLFDKSSLNYMAIKHEDLIKDAQDLNQKVFDYFKPIVIERTIQEKNKKGKKITKTIIDEKEAPKGYLLLTKYFFLGKDKPYSLENKPEYKELHDQVYKEAYCNEGICISHIIMGINYFNESFELQSMDIKKFSNSITFKNPSIIHGNYELSQEGVLKIYYFYGINGSILPNDKNVIKKLIEESQK